MYMMKRANVDGWFDYLGLSQTEPLEEDPRAEMEDPDEHETSDTDREFARYVAEHGLDTPVGGDFGGDHMFNCDCEYD